VTTFILMLPTPNELNLLSFYHARWNALPLFSKLTLGMDPHTVARGRQELMSGELPHDRVRAAGAGRLLQEKKRRRS